MGFPLRQGWNPCTPNKTKVLLYQNRYGKMPKGLLKLLGLLGRVMAGLLNFDPVLRPFSMFNELLVNEV